jgi:hypothetical protein
MWKELEEKNPQDKQNKMIRKATRNNARNEVNLLKG